MRRDGSIKKLFLPDEMLVSRLFMFPGYSLVFQVGGCFDGGCREVCCLVSCRVCKIHAKIISKKMMVFLLTSIVIFRPLDLKISLLALFSQFL